MDYRIAFHCFHQSTREIGQIKENRAASFPISSLLDEFASWLLLLPPQSRCGNLYLVLPASGLVRAYLGRKQEVEDVLSDLVIGAVLRGGAALCRCLLQLVCQ